VFLYEKKKGLIRKEEGSMKYYYYVERGPNENFLHSFFFTSYLPLRLAYWFEWKMLYRFRREFLISLLDGLVSGIPLCCIVYYLRIKRYTGKYSPVKWVDVQYVCCPYCLRTARWKTNEIKTAQELPFNPEEYFIELRGKRQ